MLISGLVKSSLIDFPGLISCVLFVPGCNYNCFYCHNRLLLDKAQSLINPEDVEKFLIKRTGKLDGVVISGGEPTLQPDLMTYMKKVKSMGFKLKLDTNGSSPDIIEKILENGICDYFAVDYKAPKNRYKEICGNGADAQKVLDTINLLLDKNADFEVRTTVIPQLNRDDLTLMAKEIPKVSRYVLNRYRPPEYYLPCDKDKILQKPYTQSQINEFKNIITSIQPHTV